MNRKTGLFSVDAFIMRRSLRFVGHPPRLQTTPTVGRYDIGNDLQFGPRPHNVPVQRRRDALSSAPHVHNEMPHLRRARDAVQPSAATGC
jgi:hypothetical protein